MTAPAITTDVHGDRYATVYVDELAECAALLARLEDWLRHAHDDTIADWTDFVGPYGTSVTDVTDMLGRWAARMRHLGQDR